jgi:hypothetical protein
MTLLFFIDCKHQVKITENVDNLHKCQNQNGFLDTADETQHQQKYSLKLDSPDEKNGTRVELGCSPVPSTVSCSHGCF